MQVSYNIIRKGLQKDVMYKGLKAKYINYCLYFGFAAILTGLIMSTFIPMALALVVTVILIILIFLVLLFYSKTYGANGFIKKMADNSKPDSIKISNSFESLLLWRKK